MSRVPPVSLRTPARKTDRRSTFCIAVAIATLLQWSPGARAAWAQTRVTIDAATVVARVQARSPWLRVAESRVGVARAQGAGADLLVRENPTLQVWGGPRVLATGEVLPDVTVALLWPFDLSGSRAPRVTAARLQLQAAEAEADEARLMAVAEGLGRWLDVLATEAEVVVAAREVETNASILQAAERRQRLGVTGAGEVAVARVSLATSQAALAQARGERRARVETLRSLLGYAAAEELDVTGSLDEPAALSLDALRRAAGRHPTTLRGLRAVERAEAEVQLQERLAAPTPRLGLGGGRENEYYGRVGVDVALPVFQRNQLGVATSRAQVALERAERALLAARVTASLESAWARYEAARESLSLLAGAVASADEATTLATRGFELGQRDLLSTLLVVREALTLQRAVLEARVRVARVRLDLQLAAGALIPAVSE
jgi:cobalt-zinc-cadmium efflux system outer membrane protein